MIDPIVVSHLSKRYGDVLAVDDLSFEVTPGRVTGFLGPNGAGKTTTLRMLLGLATPTAGRAGFGELGYADLGRPQQRVGAALEAAAHPGRTGRDHLRVLAATAEADDTRVDAVLGMVELAADGRRRVGGYSLGMRQRLALAGALLGDPDYLVLDEPANGLDPEGIRWLRGFLREWASTGRVVLVSSHLLGEVQATVDDVVVIGRGRLLHRGSVRELPVVDTRVRVRSPDPDQARMLLEAESWPVQTDTDAEGPLLWVSGVDRATVGIALASIGIVVTELATEQADLEQAFFAMIER